MKIHFLFLTLIIMSCGKKESEPTPPTPELNSPTSTSSGPLKNILWEKDYEKKFSSLPLKGKVKRDTQLWEGDYWSFRTHSINKRWMLQDDYTVEELPNEETISSFSLEDLSYLSPSEKYDLLLGNYHYPLKNEVELKFNPLALPWEGIGNGWATSTILHPEPLPKVIENPQGIQIPFGSSDIKALLSYYYAFGKNLPETKHLGFRCFVSEINSSNEENCFNDLSPKDFHLTLTNELGLREKSIVADMDQFEGVWNYPIESYEVEILNEEPLERNFKKLKIKLTLSYINNSTLHSWEPLAGRGEKKVTRKYLYELRINEQDEIESGDWLNSDRPDFLWKISGPSKFEGYFQGLKFLVEN